MGNNKQSSVEWFQEQIIKIVNGTCLLSEIEIFEQAKAMHKEEIANTYDDAIEDVRQDEERPLKGLEYYNVHFKKNSI